MTRLGADQSGHLIYLLIYSLSLPYLGETYSFPIVCLSVCHKSCSLNSYYYVSLIWGRHIVFPMVVCMSVSLYFRPSVCLSNRVRSITLQPFEILSQNLIKIIAQSDDVQRTSTVTPPTFWTELCPFETFSIEIVSAQKL